MAHYLHYYHWNQTMKAQEKKMKRNQAAAKIRMTTRLRKMMRSEFNITYSGE
jgi:hypothetical protein